MILQRVSTGKTREKRRTGSNIATAGWLAGWLSGCIIRTEPDIVDTSI
jgi:hypothetical protein